MIFRILLYLLISPLVSAQVVVLDPQGEKLSFVEVRKMNGTLIAFSNERGEIPFAVFQAANLPDTSRIQLVHTGFEVHVGLISDLKARPTVVLAYKSIWLNEVKVTAKSSVKFIRLTGYFRSFQRNNEVVTSYVDGWIELLFESGTKRLVGNHRLQERALVRLNEQKEFPAFNLIGTPMLDFSRLADFPLKSEVGYWVQDMPLLHALNQPIQRKSSFGDSFHEYHHEKFYFHPVNAVEPTLADLVFHQETRKYRMKRKHDPDFSRLEVIREFVVLQVDFLEKKPKGFSTYVGFRDKSDFESPFWEKLPPACSFWLNALVPGSLSTLTQLPNKR